MDTEKAIEYLVQQTNGVMLSFVMLVRILEKNGSLEPGRFEKALRDTFNHPDAQFDRADYKFFAHLLRQLEQDQQNPEKP